jgi:hypothetical protein
MSYWYNEFNAVFFITIISIISGCIGLILRFCLKSRCSDFKCCWGFIDIKRNNDIELPNQELPNQELLNQELPNQELLETQSNQDTILSISSLNIYQDNINNI